MKEFFDTLASSWWGITIIVLVCVIVWFLLSAVLYRQFFKRFYDFTLSFIAIVVLSPLLLILTIVGAIAMHGNPFFVQPRPGKKDRNGKERIFKLIKFRTMSNKKDENGELLPDSERLNRFGKVLRSTSLDELPELINILKGDMSIVGPRPQLVRDMVFMSERQRERHTVCPGLTGLAQVNGRNSILWEEKFEYDLEYIKKITMFGDVKILFKTVFKVLKRSDVVREGTESDMDYGDWMLSSSQITREEYDEKQAAAKMIISERR